MEDSTNPITGQVQDSSSFEPRDSSGVSFPTVGEPKKSGGTKMLLIVGILVLVAILGFVIYKGATKKSGDVSSEATPVEDLTTPSDTTVQTFTPAPSATPSAKIDRSKVKIQIQNGTGITGEAAYLQTQLSSLGYTNIKVGNSDATVTTTTATFASTLDSGVVTELTQKLNTIYQSVNTDTSASSTFDVVIVTGLRKGATPKPSGSATPKASSTPKASTSPTPRASGSPTPTPTPTRTP